MTKLAQKPRIRWGRFVHGSWSESLPRRTRRNTGERPQGERDSANHTGCTSLFFFYPNLGDCGMGFWGAYVMAVTLRCDEKGVGLEDRECPDREGSEAFYFDWNGEEGEILLGQGGEVGHVLDDGDFLLEENAVDGGL